MTIEEVRQLIDRARQDDNTYGEDGCRLTVHRQVMALMPLFFEHAVKNKWVQCPCCGEETDMTDFEGLERRLGEEEK